MRLFVLGALFATVAAALFAYRGPLTIRTQRRPRPHRAPAPPRYTLRSRPRASEPAANYEFDILEGDRTVARYWFDFRSDDHGVVFDDNREVWLRCRVGDFITGGGPTPAVFTPRAIAWLEVELGNLKPPA